MDCLEAKWLKLKVADKKKQQNSINPIGGIIHAQMFKLNGNLISVIGGKNRLQNLL